LKFGTSWDSHSRRRLYALYALFVKVGLRRGELFGLRWRDVDLDAQTITVCGQLQWLKVEEDQNRRLVWEPSPKSKAGKRVIDISQELADILKTWRRTQREERLILGPKWHGEDYVFTNEEGGPINPRSLSYGFKAGLKRAGLSQEMTLHDLRHCAGSLMLADGQDIQAVSEMLGHSSRTVTECVYAHALRNRKRQASASLGYLLRKEGKMQAMFSQLPPTLSPDAKMRRTRNADTAHSNAGGATGTRTPDPLLAKQMLSQLSYRPIPVSSRQLAVS
jgi:integrase